MSSSSSGDQQPGAYQVSNSAREFLQLQRLGVRDENILGHPSSASHTSSSHNTPPEHRAADRNRRPPDDRVRHSWQWPWDMAMENDVIDASVQSSEEWAQKERIRKKRKMIRRGICLAIVALAIVLGVIFAVLGAIQKNDESITSANPPPTTKNEGITSTNPPLGKKVDQTSAREIQLTPKLEHLLSDKSDFPPPSSQHAALVWLANEDPARIDTSDQVRLEVRFVLATLYFSMGGDRWDDKIQFLSGLNECKWKNEATGKGVTCNEEGEVTSVILSK